MPVVAPRLIRVYYNSTYSKSVPQPVKTSSRERRFSFCRVIIIINKPSSLVEAPGNDRPWDEEGRIAALADNMGAHERVSESEILTEVRPGAAGLTRHPPLEPPLFFCRKQATDFFNYLIHIALIIIPFKATGWVQSNGSNLLL